VCFEKRVNYEEQKGIMVGMFYSSPLKNTPSKNKSERDQEELERRGRKQSLCVCVQGLSTDTLL